MEIKKFLRKLNKKSFILNLKNKTTLKDIFIAINKDKLGFIILKNKKKYQIVTDGDLRRCISNKLDINQTIIKDVMTSDFKSIKSGDLAIDAAKIMEENKIFTLVVFTSNDAAGVISMHDLLQSGIV